ncbi:MAG: 4Fe-4S dicluster domain-containing protein [Nitrospinaceae bacterium]|nr:4Fe-4S dicluster domain-containing protein [Nitrospinaceae bacterium]MBT3434540.1 4Fe-4S dicluster domain-containing protein [Nitrospinaceae bacterium]MBT4429190.1 4Fe-4S dicluster domain-containing protein [Nitrospinaceae bacterium]MBT5368502.1 4Fe-4S dicluster domain-containing protein [Nitrospinaceae bacterium]MBT5947852.1 4Fe-4S dicluster domain-containing protein [Nitrospinaceae bacterium]
MSQVYNWQLGRKMAYPYEEKHPDHQFAFVFNINRCIGCQTCSMACKSTWTFSKGQEYMWWNNVESKPYGGYPQNWDVKALEMLEEANPGKQEWDATKNGARRPYGSYDGMTIFEAASRRVGPEGPQRVMGYLPSDEEWRFPNIGEDTPKGTKGVRGTYDKSGVSLPEHKNWFFYLQRICNHCTYPACLAACPRKAIYKRPEDGIVLIDQERCRGYRKCVEACPYKKSMFRTETRTSEKCIGCYPRIEGKETLANGTPWETRCMTACVGKIRMQGLVEIDKKTGDWANDPQNPIHFLVKKEKVALPLYPQFGTEPNGYYIPPRWVPRAYLHQMFGPGVDQAIERYTAPSRELLAVMQLFRAQQAIIARYEIKDGPKVYETKINGKPWALFNDTVIGYDAKGNELVSMTVEEGLQRRPAERANSI